MFKNVNYKQRIWICTILLLIILSCIAFILIINNEMLYNSSNDDIWGSNMDFIIGLVFVFPYFFSLTILLHSGYICFTSTPFLGYRRWYCVAITLSLLTVLTFWVLIIHSNLSNSLVPLLIFERTFAISLLASCISLIFDLIGTKIYYKQIKDRLNQ